MGLGKKQNVVHVVDFGLTKRYKDPKTGGHIPKKEKANFVGTAKFASANAHRGYE